MTAALALARYRVTLEALEPLHLPAYLGSTLRGAFGRAFRALCCPGRPGEPCPVPASCPYHLVFETAPPPGARALRTHEQIPRPFVIARFHCGEPLDVDFRGLIAAAASVRLAADHTRWTTWARYSARQDRRMAWSGLIGDATYEGDLRPFWPYLVFGQWTHVGKGATFGLGAYRLAAVAPEEEHGG